MFQTYNWHLLILCVVSFLNSFDNSCVIFHKCFITIYINIPFYYLFIKVSKGDSHILKTHLLKILSFKNYFERILEMSECFEQAFLTYNWAQNCTPG
jgi:hypothetical protein